MTTKLGIYSLLAGFFLAIFSGISSFMENQNIWVDLTLSKLLGPDRSESIVTLIDSLSVQNALDFLIYEMPIYGLLISVGVIFLVISLFTKNH